VVVYNFQVEGDHTYFVGDIHAEGEWVWTHNMCAARTLEGQSGRYGSLKGIARDNLTPHHMPQSALGFTSVADGGALVIPHTLHVNTRAWGTKGRITAAADSNKSFRSVLALDIKDIRKLSGSQYNQGMIQLIDYYRRNFPELMRK